jgi:hypothetical protein
MSGELLKSDQGPLSEWGRLTHKGNHKVVSECSCSQLGKGWQPYNKALSVKPRLHVRSLRKLKASKSHTQAHPIPIKSGMAFVIKGLQMVLMFCLS